MPDTSFEEATRCPRCGMPGETGQKIAAPSSSTVRPGTRVMYVWCRNDQCRWFNTNWIVQVNPDGTVPPPQEHVPGRDKQFPALGMSGDDQRVLDAITRQVDQEMQPGGGEVRGY